jgi:hypothetical protein
MEIAVSDSPDPAIAPDAIEDPVELAVPLDEFCADLSRADRRVELIAIFHHRELAAGRHHDTPSAYARRYASTGAVPAP